MLSPGAQNFSEYADYFLNAIVATFGVPKALILGSSMNSGNRAEMVVLSRHFYSLIRSNQRYMEDYFNKIFKEYALLAGFKAPVLKFGDVAEDAETNAKSAIDLFTAGIISNKEARVMIGLEGEVAESKVNPSLESDIKKSDMDAFFPEAPGKKSGSQSGVKTAQKNDEFSQVKNTKE